MMTLVVLLYLLSTLGGTAAYVDSFCSGLSIGSVLGDADLVRDGVPELPFMGHHFVGSDTYSSVFYLQKKGKPVEISSVEMRFTSADMRRPIARPVLNGIDELGSLGKESHEFSVLYNCSPRGGLATLWITVTIPRESARKACGHDPEEDLRIMGHWTKFCPTTIGNRGGLNVGTHPGGKDVVDNGMIQPHWSPDQLSQSTEVVEAGVSSSTFYVSTTDETEQWTGVVEVQGGTADKLHPIATGAGALGGKASLKENVAITVNYHCVENQPHKQVPLTMAIPLCSSNNDPHSVSPRHGITYARAGQHECSKVPQAMRKMMYEPVVIEWRKNCGGDHNSWHHPVTSLPSKAVARVHAVHRHHGLLAIFLLGSLFLVLAAGVYKFHVQGERELERLLPRPLFACGTALFGVLCCLWGLFPVGPSATSSSRKQQQQRDYERFRQQQEQQHQSAEEYAPMDGQQPQTQTRVTIRSAPDPVQARAVAASYAAGTYRPSAPAPSYQQTEDAVLSYDDEYDYEFAPPVSEQQGSSAAAAEVASALAAAGVDDEDYTGMGMTGSYDDFYATDEDDEIVVQCDPATRDAPSNKGGGAYGTTE